MSEDLELDEVDPSVGFLYKAMLQRDPRKRRVKPVQKHLIQVDFGTGDDSDDDSDFDVEKHHKGSDDSEAAEESEKEDDDNSKSDESDDEDDDDDDDDENGSDSSAVDVKEETFKSETMDYSSFPVDTKIKTEPNVMSLQQISSINTDTVKHKSIRVTICCVCLGDISEEDDEIVECDNCGVSVHEGCYGISDNQSTASTESSASTEPWFCDACKAGCKPTCELCPNFGGIFKETDAGKWVHLVCALYTPGVAFGDVDKLSPVTLFEMPYSRWGAKECTLCEDARFSRTGVCISCDAGMCRTYFHVTCAQKEGLLSESAPEECMDIADPFFAYCKMHADKMTSRAKRRNWLAIQSYIRKHPEKEIEDEKERSRFSRKLNRHRQKYQIAKAKRPPSWVPTQKLVRHLTSSPSAVRKMLRKAELMGIITQVQHVSNEKQEVRKKSHISPALSVEFVAHYIERNTKIENMRTSIKDLEIQNKKLQGQEQILRRKYDQLLSDMDKLKESTAKLKKDGEKTWNLLNDMSDEPLTLPEVFKTKKTSTRPSHIAKPTSSTASICLSPPAIINQCETCRKTHDQHMLVKCDNCRKHYHLGCLDPPLTRMPKKTANMGWQCSECDHSSSDEEEETDKNLDAPRRLREKIKEPMKWEPGDSYEYAKLTKQKNKTGKKQKVKKKKKVETESVEKPLQKEIKEVKKEEDSSPRKEAIKVSSEPPAKKPKIEETTNDIVCAVCSKEGTNSTVVRCDECGLCYHFGCLDPPFKKTPKQRGYSWHCEACDPTDDSDDDDMEEDEEPEKPLGKRIIKASIHFDD